MIPALARPWFGLAAVLVVLDQLTKHLIVQRFAEHESVAVLPVFDLTRLHNSGAAFSLLADQPGWQRWFFSGIAATVAVALSWMLWRMEKGTGRLLAACYALILAGAVGNLIDRLRYGHVVDFVHLHWGTWYYPAFNVADSAITIGALLLIVDAFRNPETT